MPFLNCFVCQVVAALLCVTMFKHVLPYELHNILSTENIEETVTGYEEELIILSDRCHLEETRKGGNGCPLILAGLSCKIDQINILFNMDVPVPEHLARR